MAKMNIRSSYPIKCGKSRITWVEPIFNRCFILKKDNRTFLTFPNQIILKKNSIIINTITL